MIKPQWDDIGVQAGAWGVGLLVGLPVVGIIIGSLWWICLAIWRGIAAMVFG